MTLFNFLVDNGASLKIFDEKGFLPIHYAVIKDHVQLVKNLQARGVNILLKDFYLETQSLLNLAVLNGSLEVVKFLFST